VGYGKCAWISRPGPVFAAAAPQAMHVPHELVRCKSGTPDPGGLIVNLSLNIAQDQLIV
jgi:hypothetical protein